MKNKIPKRKVLHLICQFCVLVDTSRKDTNQNLFLIILPRGMKSFEVNYRIVYALRTVGLGHKGLEKFCMIMNIQKPLTPVNFDTISNKIRDAAKVVANNSMNNAANELIQRSGDVVNEGVTVDGTWQRRGYSSMNGVVVAMSVNNGKVLDVEILNRYRMLCSTMSRNMKENPEQLEEWQKSHKEWCNLNYTGSAPAMEVEGAKRIFERSVVKRHLRYTTYYGDGDSKGFDTVKDTYGPDVPVNKAECVGHYQKRIGCRLRNLKKKTVGLKELTAPVIDKLQNYFGIALRANCTTVENMQNAIWASFFHVASSENNNYHSHCASSSASWCQYQRDKINGTNLHKPGAGLSMAVISVVKPIYLDLIKPDQLKECLHGLTQNQNESFNCTIWERAPKVTYCPYDKMEFAVYDAVSNFNDGRQASVDILQYLNIHPGYHTRVMAFELNKRRKYLAMYKSKETTKKTEKLYVRIGRRSM